MVDLYAYFGFLSLMLIAMLVFSLISKKNFSKKMNSMIESYNSIAIGMSKQQVLDLMGEDYNFSFLKNGIEKYEWKYKVAGVSYSSGISGIRHYRSGYTIKMTIKFKDGIVFEKTGNNLDLGSSSEDAINNYERITYGMSENEVLILLGGGYTTSLLKNGDVKYEWKIRSTGTRYTYYSKHWNASTSGGGETQKVVVIFRDHSVIEKTCNFTN